MYFGLINFNEMVNDDIYTIISTLKSVKSGWKIIKKKYIVLCYNKILNSIDLDQVLESDSSIIIGRVFKRQNEYICSENSNQEIDENFLSFIKTKWGHYIYIKVNQISKQIDIIVDGRGQLSLFFYRLHNGNIFISSDIELIVRVSKKKFRLSKNYFMSYLLYGSNAISETPFETISEVPPASILSITFDDTRIKPIEFFDKQTVSSSVVDAIENTLKSLIKPYENICLSLSGGLDSSSILLCLKEIKRKDQKLIAYNLFHKDIHQSNELLQARHICNEVGINLIEIESSDFLPFDKCLNKKDILPNKPLIGMVCLRWQEAIYDYIKTQGSCIHLSGHGSDHIFMQPPTQKSLVDYILEQGFKGFPNKLNEITHIYRDSMVSIINKTIVGLLKYYRSCLLRAPSYKNGCSDGCNLPEWLELSILFKKFIHPIFYKFPKNILPGKREQIESFYDALESIQVRIDRLQPIYYPFLYQPLVDFALSIPSYELFSAGYERFHLRSDISKRFNYNLWNTQKGETTGIYQLGIKKNIDYILDLCLKGYFVTQGLVKEESLRDNIISISNGNKKNMLYFMRLASAEIMIKKWNEASLII